jgi:iron complex outermembrane receptor protein
LHRHTGEVHALNLAGERRLNDGRVLRAGDYVYEPAGNVDWWEATGTEQLIVYVVVKGSVEYLGAHHSVLKRIDPADRIYKITGQQLNRGVEFSAVGEVVRGLTVYGGLALLNARLRDTPLASTDDKIYVGAAKVKGNALFEYQVAAVPGLVASLNYQFSGRRAANDTNSQFAPGYNLFDIGARYTSIIMEKPVALRLAVNNVTDRRYWSTIAPSNLTGANTGNLLAHLGTPRTVLASVSVDF